MVQHLLNLLPTTGRTEDERTTSDWETTIIPGETTILNKQHTINKRFLLFLEVNFIVKSPNGTESHTGRTGNSVVPLGDWMSLYPLIRARSSSNV